MESGFLWSDFLAAFALLLVLEGLLPFLSPGEWKSTMLKIAQMDDKALRVVGFFSMLAGAVLLYFVR